MKDISLFDTTFSPQKTEEYGLIIEIGPDGYSYLVFDSAKKRYVALKSEKFVSGIAMQQVTEKIEAIFKYDNLLNRKYQNIWVLFSNTDSTIIPATIFEDGNAESYLRFTHLLEENATFHINLILRLDAFLVFAVPNSLISVVQNRLPQATIRHAALPFIESVLTNSHANNEIHVCFQKQFFYVAVCQSGNLLLYNVFPFLSAQDATFYIFNILKQLKIDDKNAEIILSGNIEKDSEVVLLLKIYILNVKFAALQGEWNFSFDSVQPYEYFNLLNLVHYANY